MSSDSIRKKGGRIPAISLENVKKAASKVLSPRMKTEREGATVEVKGLTKEKKEENISTEKTKRAKNKRGKGFLFEKASLQMNDRLSEYPSDAPAKLWCFSTTALKGRGSVESEHLIDAEKLLRERRSVIIEEYSTPMGSATPVSLTGASKMLEEMPFSRVAELDKARGILSSCSGQAYSMEEACRILESAIAEIAAQRDKHYGQDLRSINGLIKSREHVVRVMERLVAQKKCSSDDLGTIHFDVLSVIKDSVSDEILKSDECSKLLLDFSRRWQAMHDGTSTVECLNALEGLYRDLRFCFPSRMNPECRMSPEEREIWVDKSLDVLVAPLSGVHGKEALKKACDAMEARDASALKEKHMQLSGSFRLVGLFTLAVKQMAVELPRSEHSAVRRSMEELQAAVARHQSLLKKYSGAGANDTLQIAIKDFDREKYEEVVAELWARSCDVLKSVNLTPEDVDRYIARQDASQNTNQDRVNSAHRMLAEILLSLRNQQPG